MFSVLCFSTALRMRFLGGLLESSWKCLNFFSNSAEGKAEEELSENEVEEQEMQEILAKANEEELKQLKR